MSVGTGVPEELSAAVDGLRSADPAALGDGEAVVALHRELERLAAVTTRAVAALDAGRAWDGDARSAAAWLTHRCRMPAGTARARTPRTEPSMDRDEQLLVEEAKRLRFASFARALAYWRWRADPDGAQAAAAAQLEGRCFSLSQSFWGVWFTDGTFDPIAGDIVARELRRIEEQLFATDWAEARARVGAEVGAADLGRTPAQRRADALVEMATRSATAPGDRRRPEPLFSVLVGYETFAGPICELANATMVTPGSLVPYLEHAWVERVVFESPSRVLAVGVRRRLFAGATRRAVEVRDRECFEPTCDVPAEQCQIDHVLPWAEGGLTTQANGRPACAFHNRRRRC